jgi:hypothetical protein
VVSLPRQVGPARGRAGGSRQAAGGYGNRASA